jgi:putative Holliday junction resolvase
MNRDTTPPGRIAGIDFGTVRMGIAITDAQRLIASPLESYTRAGPEADARRFRQLVAEHQIVRFVVGLPVHMSGQESSKSREARQFGKWLAGCTGVPVDFFDERYTTIDADAMMVEAGLGPEQRRQRRDMVAAQVLLTAYLEAAHDSASPQALDDLASSDRDQTGQ